jgi:hypothetical protein
MSVPADLHRRLLFIVHRGLVEARLLAQAGKLEQLYDLADAMEPLPGWIASWKSEHLQAVRDNLATYAKRYPDAFEHIEYIDKQEPPDF